MHKAKKMQTVAYSESLASTFGASFIAFPLGMWLSETFSSLGWPILIIGILLHSWGMFRTYQRNK